LFVRDAQGHHIEIMADQMLTAGLLHVLHEQVPRAVFLEGHDESAGLFLKLALETCGYVWSTVNLATDDIPEDAVILISAAPKRDFLSAEIVKLEHYLSHGGAAMIFYDNNTPSLERLDGFLAVWGLSVENKLVCDDQLSLADAPNRVFTPIRRGFLTSLTDLEAAGVFVIMENARPITFTPAGGRFTAHPILQTHPSSYAKDRDSGGSVTFAREDGDEPGPFSVGTIVRHSTRDSDNQQIFSHLIVSSYSLFDDQFLNEFRGSIYNLSLMADFANDFNPFALNLSALPIAPKALAGDTMLVTAAQQRAVLILLVIALPLAIFGAGLLVWRKRRHR
jgi:hypothetical protein